MYHEVEGRMYVGGGATRNFCISDDDVVWSPIIGRLVRQIYALKVLTTLKMKSFNKLID